jgi:nucleotide-binding universal stress UspA family protein
LVIAGRYVIVFDNGPADRKKGYSMFKNVLVPVDIESEKSPTDMLNAVGRLADKDAVVKFLFVVHSTPTLVTQFLPSDFEKRASEESLAKLKSLAGQGDLGKRRTEFSVSHGDVYPEILRAADEHKADLIVLGSHKPEIEDYLLGTNAARVVRHAQCTVLVLR